MSAAKKKQKPSLIQVSQPVNNTILTDEQFEIAEKIIASVDNTQIQTLGGLAGTGKTTLISHLIQKLPNFACCAFTGKAADVLRSKGVKATTIHSLIYQPIKNKKGGVDFRPKNVIPASGVIVDEASMVGTDIYQDLISYGLPIIFVGDHGQLEPVGQDIYLMSNPNYKLETVHRNAGDIALFAEHLRKGKPSKAYPVGKKVHIQSKEECIKHIANMDQIICATNSKRVIINRYVREAKGIKGDAPIIGDRVISLMNSRKKEIYNGTQGVIVAIDAENIQMKVKVNGVPKVVSVKYNINTFNEEKVNKDFDSNIHPLDYAYAVTCHKAQGSEWDKVMVIEDKCPLWDHNRWTYTAASRAKEALYWVTG